MIIQYLPGVSVDFGWWFFSVTLNLGETPANYILILYRNSLKASSM